MSDYFAALLRSSGIATPHADGAVRPIVERTAPAEASPVEQSVSLPAPDAIGEPASQPSLARAPLAIQPATAHIASEPASMPQLTIPADPADSAPTVSAESTAAPADTTSAEARSDALQSPLSHALFDAALRWVAAGEQPDRDHRRTHAHEPVPTFAEPSGHLASRPSKPAQPPGAPIALAHPVAAATVTHERSAMLPPLRSETTSNLSAVVTAAIDRDPPLDISIGAIHVRVDAPAAQTVTQPSAPRPVVAPRAAPGRSALARRALRRI